MCSACGKAATQGGRQQQLEQQSELMLKILQPEELLKGHAAAYWKALVVMLKARFECGDEEDIEFCLLQKCKTNLTVVHCPSRAVQLY